MTHEARIYRDSGPFRYRIEIITGDISGITWWTFTHAGAVRSARRKLAQLARSAVVEQAPAEIVRLAQ